MFCWSFVNVMIFCMSTTSRHTIYHTMGHVNQLSGFQEMTTKCTTVKFIGL